jgi:hypothetical protein
VAGGPGFEPRLTESEDLVFTPTPIIAPGNTVTTGFTIADTDTACATTRSSSARGAKGEPSLHTTHCSPFATALQKRNAPLRREGERVILRMRGGYNWAERYPRKVASTLSLRVVSRLVILILRPQG